MIDGDTAYARFPDGSEEKVRFIGADAPEINQRDAGRGTCHRLTNDCSGFAFQGIK